MQQVTCRHVEHEESVERQADADVVDDGDVEVAAVRSVRTKQCRGSRCQACENTSNTKFHV